MDWKNKTGKNKKVVIVDSGINQSHEKLSKYKFDGINILAGDDNINDNLGHGTAVAGIIKKLVPDVEIYVIKAFEQQYSMDINVFLKTLDYIYENIEFDVLNLSIGIVETEYLDELRNKCLKLSHKGLIVAAFDNLGAISYPAAFDFVLGVDSNIFYNDPYKFDYINGSVINILAKGGNQRTCWVNPSYLVQSGSSFACATMTGIIVKLMEKFNIHSLKDILFVLKQTANIKYDEKKYIPKSKSLNICNAIIFPYSKETDTLLKNHDLITFNICGIYDSPFSMHLGKNIDNYRINSINTLDWKDDFDTVILGHTDKLDNITNHNYYEYILNKCKQYNKNVFQFDDDGGIDHKHNISMYSPKISDVNIPPAFFGKLFQIGKPIIAIMGTSSRQGKFTLQLALRREFIKDGYKVGQLGTEPQSKLFGFDEDFCCGYNSKINFTEQTAIIYINSLLHNIEQKSPDVIILGGQSGLLPYAMYNIQYNSPYQRELLLASQPDIIILCVNYYDDIDYIIKTICYAEALTNNKVLALSLFPCLKSNTWNIVSSKYQLLSDELLCQKKHEIEKATKIKVYLQSEINELYNYIIDTLST